MLFGLLLRKGVVMYLKLVWGENSLGGAQGEIPLVG